MADPAARRGDRPPGTGPARPAEWAAALALVAAAVAVPFAFLAVIAR
ncbi:hypothetical protein [Kitasatospora sp. NPDC059571]